MNSTRNIMALIETLLADGGELGVRELGMRTESPRARSNAFCQEWKRTVGSRRTRGRRAIGSVTSCLGSRTAGRFVWRWSTSPRNC